MGGETPVTARRFCADARAVSAVEFALILPVLLILMLGGTQLVTYINATRKVELIAQSISQMISQAMPPAGSTVATVNATDLHFSFDSALVLFPYLMKDGPRQGLQWWQDIAITYAAIAFTQTASNCTGSDLSGCYAANVVWTSSGTSGGNYRPCTVPQLAAADTAPPSRSTLPRSVFGPGSIIAVDVVFTFQPSFGARFIPAVRIARSMYVQPRYASLVTFDTTGNDGIATKCPGY
ncbi:TadE/TadG family type IV pilus assembly protein [Methylobacterium sp. NEAU K]|uniref:TadE/TadG family type IV pilus assembly protein n=1 Tax=Methylobacterium sp. NEAU K TaxID=3064946 RepID=UPI0027348FD8|nr:TadE/TadG family type IV pilus assembly protein [Methylobacterium sp. NEAU K]MDP4002062.1 TadE/TadG family type IV pilus assembly protein [Methylobacterium sp. NEAU K]